MSIYQMDFEQTFSVLLKDFWKTLFVLIMDFPRTVFIHWTCYTFYNGDSMLPKLNIFLEV